jgi:hypothetical protein
MGKDGFLEALIPQRLHFAFCIPRFRVTASQLSPTSSPTARISAMALLRVTGPAFTR